MKQLRILHGKIASRQLKGCFRRQGGFTLLELIVTMAVVSLLFVGIFSAVTSAMKQYNQLNRLSDAKNISNNLYDAIQGKLQYADSMTLYDNASSAPVSTGTVQEYVLFIPPDGKMSYGKISDFSKKMFDDSYYDRYSFAVNITSTSSHTIDVSIEVSCRGEVLHVNKNTLKLENLIVSGSSVTTVPTGSGANDYIVVTFPE